MPQSIPPEPTGSPVPPVDPAPNPGGVTPPPATQPPVPPAGPAPATGAPPPLAGPIPGIPVPAAGPASMTTPFGPFQARATRPPALIVGCVTVALSALVFGFHSVDQLFPVPTDLTDPFVMQQFLYGLAHAVMALVSLAAALMLGFGTDLGRIVGAGLAGLLTWFFTGWLLRLIGDLFSSDEEMGYTLDDLGSLDMVVTVLGGILGITTLLLLSRRSISDYAANRHAPRTAAPPPPVGLHTTPVVAEPPTGSVI